MMLLYFLVWVGCEARLYLTCAIKSMTAPFKRDLVYVYRIHDLTDLIPDLSLHVLLFIVCCVVNLFYVLVQTRSLGVEDMAVCGGCELQYFMCISRFYENDDASRELLREHGVFVDSCTVSYM